MRICLVSHGFPPVERTGVENYTAGLAAALARKGHTVEVFVPRRSTRTLDLALRREERDGYAVNWLTVNQDPSGPREMLERPAVAKRFGAFLDRERPEIVHFQHVVKLGVGLVHEAARRGVPTVYTAHDYYGVCHRYTLLRPDLEHCDVRGDSMACASCDVALGYLNSLPGLGDYQMGVLPEQLTDEQWAALGELLEGDPDPAGLTDEDVDAAYDLRRELDGLRARAYTRIDRIIAPTRFLADELVRGGIDADRLEVLPYGIEIADLAVVPPVRSDPARPLRFGFFGGLSKHKGVHLLIEGWRRAALPAELSLWGYSTDLPYQMRLREAAAAAGIRWRGSYEREALPDLMAEVDVVVIPSIWVENYPIVIREAFAARRPVIALRFGALPESVRDGEDGLLVEPRDPDALAEAMRRCVEETGLVERLAAGIEPVKGIDEQARELLERYVPLVEAAARERASERPIEPPASLRAFLARLERLSSLPLRELHRRAFEGIERLRGRLEEGMGDGPADGSSLPDSHELEWLRETFEARDSELAWLREIAEGKDEEIGHLRWRLGEIESSLRSEEECRRDV